MNLDQALTAIAAYLDLDAAELLAYASEDPHGGRDTSGVWSTMSICRDEGRVLYALMRYYKPLHIVEIGTAQGCSATHMLAALEANGQGILSSIDPDPNVGVFIPITLRDRWRPNIGSVHELPILRGDIVFEDSLHTYEHTWKTLAMMKATTPKLLMVHDVAEYPDVNRAFEQITDGNGCIVTVDPATAGLGFYRSRA